MDKKSTEFTMNHEYSILKDNKQNKNAKFV